MMLLFDGSRREDDVGEWLCIGSHATWLGNVAPDRTGKELGDDFHLEGVMEGAPPAILQ